MLSFVLGFRGIPSTNTHNRFRWAVCQIDVLQRLKCERHIVKNALENLPRTLDETYDRIFLNIPEEERLFVYHALQWISYHYKLHGGGISCSVLLQAAARSAAMLNDSQNVRFYDNDTLRELCGCLINIGPEMTGYYSEEISHTTLTVTFAHYTVREYLDSTRMSNPTASFTTCKKGLEQKFMEVTFSEAHHIESNELWEWETALKDFSDVCDAIYGDFNSYCIVSALLSLHEQQHEICQKGTLCTLAIELLDPSKPHFEILDAAARHIEESTSYFSDREWFREAQFWEVMWDPGSRNTDAVHLFYLLLLAADSDENLALAKEFLQRKDAKDFLQSRLTFHKEVQYVTSEDDMETYGFDGSIVEVYAQLAIGVAGGFKLLLEYGTGHFDPSKFSCYSLDHMTII
jgi:hypothetical protein